MAERIERQVARKAWISELRDGEMVVTEGIQPNVLKTARGDVARVNVIGIVVSAEELPVSSVAIDDGTATIPVRSFERPMNVQVGDLVQVIGRPRIYQREPYIAAEAWTRVSPGWAAYRKRELGPPLVMEKKATEPPEPETKETGAELVLRLIAELDRGDGAPVEDVIARSRLRDAERVIEQLMLAGDIFELRPGKVKVL